MAEIKSLRILLASFGDDNRWSGLGKWSHCMAEGLARLGHRPTLWFADDFPLVKRTGRLSVLVFPVALAFRLWRARRDFNAVVIHEPSGFWYGLLRRLIPLPPMLLMCHSVESKIFRELIEAARRGRAVMRAGTRIKTPLLRLWQSDGAIKLADHVICLSSFDREYIVYRLNHAPKQVTLKINGVAAEYFQERRATSSGQRVLFVGGWLNNKGRCVLPSIWSNVRSSFPQARLTVVGSGQSVESVLADFRECDRVSVTVIPHLSDESEMVAQYTSHDLFLMPSLSEGSPLSLLEAMAAGLPVVASSVGGIPDIITNESNGLLFDVSEPESGAERVCRLLADPAYAARLGSAGRERARELTWDAAAQKLEGALIALLKLGGEADAARRAGVPEGEASSFRVIGE